MQISEQHGIENRSFGLLWTIANILLGAVILVFMNFSYLWAARHGLMGEDLAAGLIYYVVVGTSVFVFVGTVQFLLLQKRILVSRWWIWIYFAGYGIIGLVLLTTFGGAVIFDLFPRAFWNELVPGAYRYVFNLFLGVSTGTGVGLLQWLLLRSHFDGAGKWFGICLLSGTVSGLAMLSQLDNWGLGTFVVIQGILSGLLLYRRPFHWGQGKPELPIQREETHATTHLASDR